jgi:hypothetical protein
MPRFTVTHEVTDQFIGDIMICAVECNAVDYWAAIIEVKRVPGYNDPEVNVSEGLPALDPLTVTSFMIRDIDTMDDEDGEPEFPPTEVNAETITKGIAALLSGQVSVSDDILRQISYAVANNDCDIDAWGADCIVQAGVLNEIRFS